MAWLKNFQRKSATKGFVRNSLKGFNAPLVWAHLDASKLDDQGYLLFELVDPWNDQSGNERHFTDIDTDDPDYVEIDSLAAARFSRHGDGFSDIELLSLEEKPPEDEPFAVISAFRVDSSILNYAADGCIQIGDSELDPTRHTIWSLSDVDSGTSTNIFTVYYEWEDNCDNNPSVDLWLQYGTSMLKSIALPSQGSHLIVVGVIVHDLSGDMGSVEWIAKGVDPDAWHATPPYTPVTWGAIDKWFLGGNGKSIEAPGTAWHHEHKILADQGDISRETVEAEVDAMVDKWS